VEHNTVPLFKQTRAVLLPSILSQLPHQAVSCCVTRHGPN